PRRRGAALRRACGRPVTVTRRLCRTSRPRGAEHRTLHPTSRRLFRRPRHRKGGEVKRYTPPSPTSSRSPRRGVAPVLSRRAALGLGLVVGGAAALPGSAALAAPGAGTSPPCAHSRARWNR